jgi:hypothetical protein
MDVRDFPLRPDSCPIDPLRGTNMRSIAAIAAIVVFASCEGPTGPAGPEGDPGSPGTNGTPNRVSITAVVDGAGAASVDLPAAIGAPPTNIPTVACYRTTSAPNGPWTNNDAACAISYSSGQWHAQTAGLPVGTTVAFVVTY